MTAGTAPVNAGQVDTGPGDESFGGVGRGISLAERGYVHAHFGDIPVLVGPELAAQLKAIRQAPECRS